MTWIQSYKLSVSAVVDTISIARLGVVQIATLICGLNLPLQCPSQLLIEQFLKIVNDVTYGYLNFFLTLSVARYFVKEKVNVLFLNNLKK